MPRPNAYSPALVRSALVLARQRLAAREQHVRTLPPVPLDIVEWAHARFYIPSTEKPIALLPHQQAILRLAFTRNADGYLPYRLLTYCLGPSTRVLTRDLRWVPVGSLAVGDALVGFDDKMPGGRGNNRRYRDALVTATGRATVPVRYLTFSDGTVITASLEHPWLIRRDRKDGRLMPNLRPVNRMQMNIDWARTEELRVGDWFPRMLRPWHEERSWEAGYLAAAFDGEGCLDGELHTLQFAQKDNEMLATFKRLCDELGVSYRDYFYGTAKGVHSLHIKRRSHVLRVLGSIRPQRLLAKLRLDGLGMLTEENVQLVSIEDGVDEVVTLSTSTETYLAEGFGSHNSTVKQSGKSTISGLVLRWYAETQARYAELYAVGNDLMQAQGRGFREARISLELSPGYDKAHDRVPGEWALAATTMRSIRTGSLIRALAVDARGEAGGKPAIQVWCVDDQTEALTRDGWKLVHELTPEDEIAVLKPTTNTMVWERPRTVAKFDYAGPMLHFKHRRADFMVTPNHRVWCKTAHKTADIPNAAWRFAEAQTLTKVSHGFLEGTAHWESDAFPVEPAMAKLIGYYLAEGCYLPNDRAVNISQSLSANPDKHEEIAQLAISLGLLVYRYDDRLRIVSPELSALVAGQGRQHERLIPKPLKDAHPRLLQAFWEGYMAGDGTILVNKRGTVSYKAVTVSRQLADDLMEVGLKLGYHPHLKVYPYERTNHQVYRVYFATAPCYWSSQGKHWETVPYEGVVACPSVSTGIFYIRRNGKCCWTGNTELWGAEHKEALRFWDELTPIPTVPDSMRLVETYAGFEKESMLLKGVYDTGLAGRQLTAGELSARTGAPLDAFAECSHPDDPVPIWENRVAQQLTYWDSGPQARRMPWQQGERGEDYYRGEAVRLMPAAFRRFHENQWVSSEAAFVPEAAWAACRDESLPRYLEPGDMTPVVLGVDAGVTGDCFAIVAVSRHPQRHDEVAVRAVRIFNPALLVSGEVNFDEAETFLRQVCGGSCPAGLHARSKPDPECDACRSGEWLPGNNVLQIAYDPYQLESTMQRLRQDAAAWCAPFSQAGDRLRADRALYDLIITRRLWHNGDENLTEHVLNAGAKVQKDEESTLRLVKVSPNRKIDAAVALSMACARMLYLRV